MYYGIKKNRTPNIRRMSGDLVQKLVAKNCVCHRSFFSQRDGTWERATARRANCRPFTADASDKFFVIVCRTLVSCVSQSKHLIGGLRFYPGCPILLNLLSELMKDYRKKVQLLAVGRCGAQKGQKYFILYFQHAYLLEVREGRIQFNGRMCEIYGGCSNNGEGFSPEYSVFICPYHSIRTQHLNLFILCIQGKSN